MPPYKKAWVNHAYKPHMHAHAANFIRNKLRRALNWERIGIVARFKKNVIRRNNRSYKVGWSQPTDGTRAQLQWRRAYYKKYGRVT